LSPSADLPRRDSRIGRLLTFALVVVDVGASATRGQAFWPARRGFLCFLTALFFYSSHLNILAVMYCT
jgi:hypothetical protein